MRREDDIADFLAAAGWSKCQTETMDADFSSRRFTRLHRDDGKTAVLMVADEKQRTTEFVTLAWLLRGIDLSAPQIFAERKQQGLVLMEDLGDGNVGRMLDGGMNEAEEFYLRAAETLAHLHRNFVVTTVNDLNLPRFSAAVFTKQAELFLDGYLPFAIKRMPTEEERKSFRAVWLDILKPVEALPQTLMLRDFMPDNVMFMPERKGWRTLGLLDFQDAGIGPIAYDLTSFCEVVRRDGGDIYLRRVLAKYFECMKPACTWDELMKAATILAAQRHTRILGLLGNIAKKIPTSPKLAYLPRVQAYVKHLQESEALAPFNAWMNATGLSL